jgi:hypothetical protein
MRGAAFSLHPTGPSAKPSNPTTRSDTVDLFTDDQRSGMRREVSPAIAEGWARIEARAAAKDSNAMSVPQLLEITP